jgi:hypothetical protein
VGFALITDFIPPEWLWATALVALWLRNSHSKAGIAIFYGADAWRFLAFLSLIGRAEG